MNQIIAIVFAVVAVLVAVILLAIRVIIKKNGQFSSQHISQNRRMRERGIHCAVSQDREAKKSAAKKLDVKSL